MSPIAIRAVARPASQGMSRAALLNSRSAPLLPRSMTSKRLSNPSHPLTPQPLTHRTLHTTPTMSDEYSKKAVNPEPTLKEKLADARKFIASHKTVLLTTRSPNGQLHARTMAIAEVTPDWKFRFIYDGESYKEKEVDNDKHVNIAYDGSEKNAGWISIAGIAAHSNDKALVEKLYNPTIKAWFGDKGDGVHNGEPSDPRITVMEVTVQQIRHFYQARTALGTVTDVITSTITGNVAQPGEIRQIEGAEIERAWKAGELKEAGI